MKHLQTAKKTRAHDVNIDRSDAIAHAHRPQPNHFRLVSDFFLVVAKRTRSFSFWTFPSFWLSLWLLHIFSFARNNQTTKYSVTLCLLLGLPTLLPNIFPSDFLFFLLIFSILCKKTNEKKKNTKTIHFSLRKSTRLQRFHFLLTFSCLNPISIRILGRNQDPKESKTLKNSLVSRRRKDETFR